MEKTIAAISTAPSAGGIGIIRISGENAKEIAEKVFLPKGKKTVREAAGYSALYGHAVSSAGEVLDEVLALVFTAPKSYTGEDVVEISCHGGTIVMNRILKEVLAAGAAVAEPGEFTKRAFLNGRIDLTQAEAVMELIGAKSEEAAKTAAAGGEGTLERKMKGLKESLVSAGAHLSAWADYPEEEVPEITPEELEQTLISALSETEKLLARFEYGKAAREGVRTVIVGKPNVGKSTLMNLLAGHERSIVTEYAGTTRDIVEEVVNFGGLPLYIADTAGIHDTKDPVESIGVNRAKDALCQAQLVLAVFDASRSLSQEDREIISTIGNIPAIAIINKTDLEPLLDTEILKKSFARLIYFSARSGEGLENLEAAVRDVLLAEKIDPADGALYTER